MTTIYTLTRDLSGDHELIHMSTDRKHLADLMRVDIDKWTVPVTYTIEIALGFDNLLRDGRISAFREAAEYFDQYADTFPDYSDQRSAFRYASVKLFSLMGQETAK